MARPIKQPAGATRQTVLEALDAMGCLYPIEETVDVYDRATNSCTEITAKVHLGIEHLVVELMQWLKDSWFDNDAARPTVNMALDKNGRLQVAALRVKSLFEAWRTPTEVEFSPAVNDLILLSTWASIACTRKMRNKGSLIEMEFLNGAPAAPGSKQTELLVVPRTHIFAIDLNLNLDALGLRDTLTESQQAHILAVGYNFCGENNVPDSFFNTVTTEKVVYPEETVFRNLIFGADPPPRKYIIGFSGGVPIKQPAGATRQTVLEALDAMGCRYPIEETVDVYDRATNSCTEITAKVHLGIEHLVVELMQWLKDNCVKSGYMMTVNMALDKNGRLQVAALRVNSLFEAGRSFNLAEFSPAVNDLILLSTWASIACTRRMRNKGSLTEMEFLNGAPAAAGSKQTELLTVHPHTIFAIDLNLNLGALGLGDTLTESQQAHILAVGYNFCGENNVPDSFFNTVTTEKVVYPEETVFRNLIFGADPPPRKCLPNRTSTADTGAPGIDFVPINSKPGIKSLIIVESSSALTAVFNCREYLRFPCAIIAMHNTPLPGETEQDVSQRFLSTFEKVGIARETDYRDDKAFSQLTYQQIYLLFDPDTQGEGRTSRFCNQLKQFSPSLFSRFLFIQRVRLSLYTVADKYGAQTVCTSKVQFDVLPAETTGYGCLPVAGVGTYTSAVLMAFFVNFGNYCFPCTPKYKQVIQLPFVDGSVANMQFPQLLTEVTEALPNGDDVPSLEDGLRVTWRALLLIAHVNPGRTLPVATFHHRLVASSNCTDSPAQTAILYIDRKLPGYSNLSLVNVIGTLGSAVLGPVNQYQTRYLQISANPILNECFAFSPNDSPTAPLQTLVPWVLVIKGTHQQSALYKASDVVRSLLSKVTTGTVSKLTPSFRHFRGGMHLSPSGQYYVTNSITVLRPGVISITGFIGFKNGRIISYLTPKLCDAHLVKTYKIFGNEVHCLIIVHLAEAGMKLSVRELDRVFSCRHNLTSEYKLRASDGQVTVHTSAEDVVAVFSEVLIRRFRVQVATELDDLNWALLQLQAKITYLQDIVFTNRENGPFPADTDITMADLKAIDYAIYPPEILQEVLQFAASRATRAELVRLINEHDTRKAALDALDGPWTEGPRRCGEALRNLLPHLEEAEKRDDAYGKDAYNELWGFAREYLQEGIFGDGVLGDDENISDVDDFAQ